FFFQAEDGIRAFHVTVVQTCALPIYWIAFVLVVVGGLNWGLVGLFELDVVASLFGDDSLVSRAVYLLVGLATVYLLTSMLIPRKIGRASCSEQVKYKMHNS